MGISKNRCGLSFFVQSVICDHGQMVPDSEVILSWKKKTMLFLVNGTLCYTGCNYTEEGMMGGRWSTNLLIPGNRIFYSHGKQD